MLSPENILHELLGSDVALRHRNLNWLIMAPYIWIKRISIRGSSECFIESIENGACTRSDSHRLIPVRFRLITCTIVLYVSTCNKGLLADSYIMRLHE